MDFPSSPSSAIAPRRSKFDLSSQPSALSALRDRSSAIAREDDICQKCQIGSEGQRDMVYGGGFDMVETVSFEFYMFLNYVSSYFSPYTYINCFIAIFYILNVPLFFFNFNNTFSVLSHYVSYYHISICFIRNFYI